MKKKTNEEIDEKIQELCKIYLMGSSIVENLILFLDYEFAENYVKFTEITWKDIQEPYTYENIQKNIYDLLVYARRKAKRQQSFHLGRTIREIIDYLWLLGDDEMIQFAADPMNYINDCQSILRKLRETYV